MVKFNFKRSREDAYTLHIHMEHYVCTGECRGVSDVPKMCGALGCHKKEKPFTECNCEDGKHADAFEKKRREMEEGKKNRA